jgi:hypothetical protein
MKKLILILTMLTVLSATNPKENQEFDWKKIIYKDLATIERYGLVYVHLQGSAKDIGLDQDELSDYMKLKYKNNFSTVPYNKDENLILLGMNIDEQKKVGIMHINIWTVGDDYPVAYHIEIFSGPFYDESIYNNAVLGYDAADNIEKIVKETITKMIEELAITYFKIREEI